MAVSTTINKPTKRLSWAPLLIVLATLVSACAGVATPLRTATPIMIKCMFDMELVPRRAFAYFDANGDGLLDSTDPPLQGAVFVVRFPNASTREEIRGVTDAKGEAVVRVTIGYMYDPDPQCSLPDTPEASIEPPPGYELISEAGSYETGYYYLFRKAQQ